MSSVPSTSAAPHGAVKRGALGRFFARFVPSGRTTVIGVPFIWLALFFALPFVLVLKISFADQVMGIPPYSNLVEMKDGM
ncbi:putrescine ABC transporter permease PotH, partial [Burkholderia sp. Ax-1719]|nr:putrescine ABC transporter permease PotH [Burkholderia sp. Ax-1719]